MSDNKYSKVLTVILIIAILIIIGLLIFIGIDWYKAYTTGSNTEDFFEQFNSYIENTNKNDENEQNNSENVQNNTTIDNNEEQNNIVEEPDQNTENNNSSNGLTLNGMQVVGTIEIPKTNVKYAILNDPSSKAMDTGITMLYGPGINQIGNTVLAGHNYRNGTFFSNNKKLAVGDKIYLTDVKGNKVEYTITYKYNADANDFSYATRDTKGKREISLTTCTDDSNSRIIIWAQES